MKKAFTIIELMVTVVIVVLIAAASGPALKSSRDRSNLDSAANQIRDLISQTQSYALAPERNIANGYVLVINDGMFNGGAENYGSPTQTALSPGNYGIFSIEGATTRNLIKQGTLSILPTYDSSQGTGYQDPTTTNLFKINFRTLDGAAGCINIYYTDSGWSTSTCNPSVTYVALKITAGGLYKEVKINKITGETEICLCSDSTCATCTST